MVSPPTALAGNWHVRQFGCNAAWVVGVAADEVVARRWPKAPMPREWMQERRRRVPLMLRLHPLETIAICQLRAECVKSKYSDTGKGLTALCPGVTATPNRTMQDITGQCPGMSGSKNT
jgi:hypothetical protein